MRGHKSKKMTVRNTIKEFVEGLEITVYEFRKRTGISQDTAYTLYHHPERIPNGSVIGKICDAFEVQPDKFIRWEKKNEDKP